MRQPNTRRIARALATTVFALHFLTGITAQPLAPVQPLAPGPSLAQDPPRSRGSRLAKEPPPASDFVVKAFHLDMRIQVMTMPALRVFAQKLHDQGINTLIMEYEANYPFTGQLLIPGRYAYTREEIKSFVHYCNGLGIDLIPLQQSFGHVEYILRNYKYAALREDERDLSQVCPLETEKDSLLFSTLFKEMAATHTSKYIHIGCDETHLLGHCPRCSKKVAAEGVSKLYLDYVKMLCDIVIGMGKCPVLWADIAIKYPEALHSLPKQTVFVDWNYGWELDRFGQHQKLLESGFEIWGAPALRSHPDNFFLTQWEKHFRNIRDFVPLSRKMGYKGIVMTSWSTSGEYDAVYEAEQGLTELNAVRHVYPITGFNILLAAYAQSIDNPEPLDINNFITTYCVKQYGFSAEQSASFWQALKTAPYEVVNGVVRGPCTLDALVDSVSRAGKIFQTLNPSKNRDEFNHYRLMNRIRLAYLKTLLIEKALQTYPFTETDDAKHPKDRDSLFLGQALDQLKELVGPEAAAIDAAFIALNRSSFYVSEMQEENRIREKRAKYLYDKLYKAR